MDVEDGHAVVASFILAHRKITSEILLALMYKSKTHTHTLLLNNTYPILIL
jgi:hypothetical protein